MGNLRSEVGNDLDCDIIINVFKLHVQTIILGESIKLLIPQTMVLNVLLPFFEKDGFGSK